MICCECGSHNVVSNEKETYCEECGMVLTDEFFDTRGARVYDNEDYFRKSQHGAPENINVFDKGLSTPRQPQLKNINLPQRANFSDHKDKTLKSLLSESGRLISELKLSNDVKAESAFLLRKLYEKGTLRGQKIEYIVGVSVFIAAKRLHTPCTLKEIKGVLNYKGGRKKGYREKIFNTALKKFKILKLKLVYISAEEYLPKFIAKLGLDYTIEKKARELIVSTKLNTINKVGAAVAIFGVLKRDNDRPGLLGDVSEKCGIAIMTLRHYYREMLQPLGFPILPKKSHKKKYETTCECGDTITMAPSGELSCKKCPGCGKNLVIGGYHYLELGKKAFWCQNCGLVLGSEFTNSHNGFTQFKKDQYYPDSNKYYDRGLGSRKQPKLKTVRSHVTINQIKGKDKTLKLLFDENNLLISLLHLNADVGNECAFLTHQLIDKTDLKGTHLEFISGSIIHIAATRLRIPLDLLEIDRLINYHGTRKLSVVEEFVKKKLNLPIPMLTAEDYLSKFACNLNLDYQHQKEAQNVLKQMYLNGGKSETKAAFSLLVTMIDTKNAMKNIVNGCHVTESQIIGLVKYVSEPLKSDIISKCQLSVPEVNKIPLNDTITCKICGMELKKITYLHLKLHGMTLDDYRERFPNAPLTSDQTRENNKTARLGAEVSEITKQKLSESHIGKTSPRKGKHLTDDSKQKISESLVKYFSEKREA